MSTLKYTQTRRIVLMLVEPGGHAIYQCTNEARDVWKYEATFGVLGGAEARCLGEMAKAGLVEHPPRPASTGPAPPVR